MVLLYNGNMDNIVYIEYNLCHAPMRVLISYVAELQRAVNLPSLFIWAVQKKSKPATLDLIFFILWLRDRKKVLLTIF